MTDPLDPLDRAPEPDDRPAALVAPPQPGVLPEQRRGGRLVKWWLLTSLVLVVTSIVCLAIGLSNVDVLPLHIVIDGDDVTPGISITGVSAGLHVLIAVGAVLLALVLLLLVPMVLLLILGALAIALVAGLGMPLVALLLALAVVSSPLWLLGLVIWLIVRRRPTAPVTIHA